MVVTIFCINSVLLLSVLYVLSPTEVSKSTQHRAMDPVLELYWDHVLAGRITALLSESGSLVVFGVSTLMVSLKYTLQ